MMECTARCGAIMGVGLLYRIGSFMPEPLINLENSADSVSPLPASKMVPLLAVAICQVLCVVMSTMQS